MARNSFLLCVSYIFYCAWDYRFLSLILISTTIDFFAGREMVKSTDARKKILLYLSVMSNLGILFFFKYFNFFLASISCLGFEPSLLNSLNIILPIGISFYTFQSLSYTIDVFRGGQKPEKNFITFALYVAFFPQILAGPIERANRLLPQLKAQKGLNLTDLSRGFDRFFIGMIKKVVISPAIFTYSTSILLNPSLSSVSEAWIKGGAWFLYLLMDFSGYSDMAIGIARMFGIRLSENFKMVLKTQDFSDFWKRWHVTLSEWFRDYVHVPLQQRGLSKYQAGFISFTLIGIWHGASWKFLVWGIGMGFVWCIDKRFSPMKRLSHQFPSAVQSALNTAGFLAVFLLFGPFFAAHNLSDAGLIVKAMLGLSNPVHGAVLADASVPLIFSICLAITLEQYDWQNHSELKLKGSWGKKLKLFVLVPLGILLCVEGLWSSLEFKYYQF